jgi:hypothetical protein
MKDDRQHDAVSQQCSNREMSEPTPSSSNANPYAAPMVPSAAEAQEPVPEPKRIFRWRLIPTLLCSLFALPNVVVFIAAAVGSLTHPYESDELDLIFLLIMSGFALIGTGVAVGAATSWWKKRWIRAIVFTVFIMMHLFGGPPAVDWLLSTVNL